MSDQRSPSWQGISYLVLGLAALGWEWSRDHHAVGWWPSRAEILLVILAPVFCLVGIRMVLARTREWPGGGGIDAGADPYTLSGVLLGIANAYLLGVWQSVTGEGLLAFAPLLLIAGLIAGVMAVRAWRARPRANASRNTDES